MTKRTWTDEQLRDAVARQSSWRGALRALGLKSTSSGSMRTVQRRSIHLGLETSHFRRNRKWSDHQLKDAVKTSTTWDEVIERVGLSKEGGTALRLKGHAVRLGLDVSHLKPLPEQRPSIEHLTSEANAAELRNAAPALATAWFSLRGLPVAVPSEPQAYDLLVTTPAGFQRVQVKTTTFAVGNGTWQVSIGHRPYILDKTASKEPYDPETIDCFFIINGAGDLYLIPIEAVAGYTAIYLSAYSDYKVGDVSSLLN
jgi:PD-(D/E)XK endonuclease